MRRVICLIHFREKGGASRYEDIKVGPHLFGEKDVAFHPPGAAPGLCI
jgi:hypothetical protein